VGYSRATIIGERPAGCRLPGYVTDLPRAITIRLHCNHKGKIDNIIYESLLYGFGMKETEIKTVGYECIERKVKTAGNTGRIYLPVAWVGKSVKIILLDEIEPED